MSKPKAIEGGVTAPRGFRACGVHCGVKASDADLAMILSERPAAVGAVFTTNRIQGAPVKLCRERLGAVGDLGFLLGREVFQTDGARAGVDRDGGGFSAPGIRAHGNGSAGENEEENSPGDGIHTVLPFAGARSLRSPKEVSMACSGALSKTKPPAVQPSSPR